MLSEQLKALHETLLQEHTHEVQHLRNANLLLREELLRAHQSGHSGHLPRSASAVPGGLSPGKGSAASMRKSMSLESLDEKVPDGAVDRWAHLFIKLTQREYDSSAVSTVSEDGDGSQNLVMRTSWAIPWEKAMRIHHGRKIRVSRSEQLTSAMHMKDRVKDDSFLQRFVFGPYSLFPLLWSVIGCGLILWDLVTIPLEMFDNIPDFIAFLQAMGKVTFAFWLLDMLLNVLVGVEVNGKVELRPAILACRYFRTWFILDLLVVSLDAVLISLEALLGDQGAEAGLKSARFLRTLRMLRLVRLARVAKLQQEFTLLANRFLSSNAFLVAKILGGLLMILAITHLVACCWFGVAAWTHQASSWLIRAELEEANFFESYAASIHWSMTQFTPATTNIAPANGIERLFAVCVILLAIGVFSSFITSLSATVSSLRNSRAERFQQQSALLQFFTERNLSTDLYCKVTEALRRRNVKKRIKEGEVQLLGALPERMKMQLHEEMFLPRLKCLGIWPEWSLEEDDYFFKSLCHYALAEHACAPGQDAFMPGTDCNEVYIIESGSKGYLSRQSVSQSMCGEDEVICMASLWAAWYHRGRLTASHGTCFYVGINCEEFGRLAGSHGGPLWQYLQVFGMLLVGTVEVLEDHGEDLSDLSLPMEKLYHLGNRAQHLVRKAARFFRGSRGYRSESKASSTSISRLDSRLEFADSRPSLTRDESNNSLSV